MSIEQLVFYIISAIALISSLLVVSIKNFVRSVFLFFITMLGMAGLFVFALADFVAITQLVIYVGGVLVLMIFAFLLSNKQLLNNPEIVNSSSGAFKNLPAIFVAVSFAALLIITFSSLNPSAFAWIAAAEHNTFKPTDNTIHYLGINIITRYLLPFEIISVLLLMALIGAAHLARKEKKL